MPAATKKPTLRTYGEVLKGSATNWYNHNADRLGAAVAFYSLLSLGPLLILLLAGASLIFGQEAARGQISAQIGGAVGYDTARMIEDLIAASSAKPQQGIIATILGFVTLLIGASGIFSQLQDALNTIWNTEEPERPWWGFLINRAVSLAVVLMGGVLLVASLAISASLSAASEHTTLLQPEIAIALQTANFILSLVVMTVLFALLFRVLPDTDIAWRDVWVGALLTAVLFTIGKSLIGLYLGHTGVASTYGAAGSLVVLLIWIYYSAQILFFGAEFTKVYAHKLGSKVAHI